MQKPSLKEKKESAATYHDYFQAHQCHIPADKMTIDYGQQCGRLRRFILNLTTVMVGDIRARNMYKSYAALRSEKNRQYHSYPMSIHPFSKIRIWCEAYFFILMLTSNTMISVDFSAPLPIQDEYLNKLILTFDLMYIIHIIMNFFTGYIAGDTCQYVVLDLRKIWFRYATTWMVVDFMAAFCFVPTLLIDSKHILPYIILVSMKLLRMPIMMVYLNNVMTVLRAGIFKRTIIQITILIFSYLTWNIYFQFVMEYIYEGSYQPEKPRMCSWITKANLWNDTTGIRFVYALDRAVGMLRKNTNIDLTLKDGCFENFFVISWFIAKLLVYHCALKYIVALFGSESAKAKYFIITKEVESYMNIRKFPPRIKQKIMKFYSIRYQSNYFEELKMLAYVTGQLREDIIMHTGRQLVRELVFLKQLPRSLLLHIWLKLRPVIFLEGDIIFKINSVGDCIYFIDKGTVAIYSESGKEICHLEDGDFFGEIALIMKHSVRTASVVAVTNCELLRLDREEFNKSIACYPTVYETVRKVAIKRFEQMCVLDAHHKTEITQSKQSG